jgi:hypothetical protein
MRITRQTIQPLEGTDQVPDRDVIIRSHEQLPPPIILDYAYGVAAYNRWQSHTSEQFREYMEHRSTEVYQNPPPNPKRVHSQGFEHSSEDSSESAEAPDRTSPSMLKAMDDLALLGRLLSDVTPEMHEERQRKREEEEQLRTQKTSQEKVQEWLQR